MNSYKKLVANKLHILVEKSKANQKLRTEYLAINLHDRDIKRQAYNAGVQQGFSQGTEQKALKTAKEVK